MANTTVVEESARQPINPWQLVCVGFMFAILWTTFSGERVYLTDGEASLRRFSWWGFASHELTVGIKRSDDLEPQQIPDDARWFYKSDRGWCSFEVRPEAGDPTNEGSN
jgi:hypothetical protein